LFHYQHLSKKGEVDMNGARILLVEDDEGLCDVVAHNLQVRGHEVRLAVDVAGALAQLHAHTFDLIFLDINLPDQTGWDVLRIAQNEGDIYLQHIDGQGEKLPVVIMSAVRVSPNRLAEFHPLAYLPKPFPMEALIRLAAEAAQRNKGTVSVPRKDAAAELSEDV